MLIRYARPALTLTRIRLGGRSANRNRVQCDCFNTYRGMEPGDEQPTNHCSLRYWRLRASLARRAGAKPWLIGSFLALLLVSGIVATQGPASPPIGNSSPGGGGAGADAVRQQGWGGMSVRHLKCRSNVRSGFDVDQLPAPTQASTVHDSD